MAQIVLAGVVVLGMALIVLFGVTRIFRQRKITMVDYPELPPPSAGSPNDRSAGGASNGPTMNA
ncbi:MAG TPA: hypothetical protein VG942_11015 [Hyphomonadaceae bacterium]|nr:hypothetical protein [Hyphomonadaceae bacterium]